MPRPPTMSGRHAIRIPPHLLSSRQRGVRPFGGLKHPGRARRLWHRNRTIGGLIRRRTPGSRPASGSTISSIPSYLPQASRPTSTSERPRSRKEGLEPAGIEPATPSLPSMPGRFTTPCDTSHPYTTAQVSTAVEGCIVRRSEAARSAVSGKSLARKRATHCVPECPDPLAAGSNPSCPPYRAPTRAVRALGSGVRG
jgi:hypothetical protein